MIFSHKIKSSGQISTFMVCLWYMTVITAVLTRYCLGVNAEQCVWFTINLQWFPGAHQEVVTRELAEHWLVVRTDQENSGSVHHHS